MHAQEKNINISEVGNVYINAGGGHTHAHSHTVNTRSVSQTSRKFQSNSGQRGGLAHILEGAENLNRDAQQGRGLMQMFRGSVENLTGGPWQRGGLAQILEGAENLNGDAGQRGGLAQTLEGAENLNGDAQQGGGFMQMFRESVENLTSQLGHGGGLLQSLLSAENISEEDGSSSNSTFSWKTDLDWMMSHEETIESMHSNEKLYEAYGFHEKIHQFDPDERDIRFQMHYCLSLMLTNREVQANKAFDKIVSSIRKMGETFQSVLRLAEKTVKIEGKSFEAILLCLIAAKISDMSIFTVSDSADKSKCMNVLRTAAGKISDNNKKAKPFLRRYCLKGARPLLEHIQQTAPDNMYKNLISLRIATFHCMEILLLYADEDEERALLLERALQFLREAYGTEVLKKKWYGTFSSNLGATYLSLSRPDKTAEALSRAIEVFKQATDFDDEMERQQDIRSAEQMLYQPGLGSLGVAKQTHR